MADINSRLPTSDYADGVPGSAIPTDAILVGGTDGTNLRSLSTSTTGILNVEQPIQTVTGTLTSGSSVVTMNMQGAGALNIDVSGPGFVGTITITENTPSAARILGVFALNGSSIASSITANGTYRVVGVPVAPTISVQFSSYTSGSATINLYASAATYIVQPYNANAANLLVTSYLDDGVGNPLNSISYNGSTALQIVPQDGFNLDGVGRQRVSEVTLLANYCFYSGLLPLDFNTQLTGAATVTFNANGAAAQLNTTTASGDAVIYQTKQYWPYAPNISHLVNIAGTMGAAKAGTTQRWGIYDANDGLGFYQTSLGINVFLRTSTSGTPTDTTIPQASWNIDKLDGTGASGITLNTADHNQYIVNYVWHGAGRIRYGIFYNGKPYYFHQINEANTNTVPYTRTPKLPIRMELTNTSAPASATAMYIVCTSLAQESSSPQIPRFNFSKSNGVTTRSVTSSGLPILSLQPLASYNGITNRTSLVPQTLQVFSDTAQVLVQVVLNGTLTGSSFASVNTNSSAQYDVSATALTGGTIIAEFYVASGGSQTYNLTQFVNTSVLSNSIVGTSGADILTIYVTSFAATTNSIATIQWQEF